MANIFHVATILKQLGMIKGNDTINDNFIINEVEINFRLKKQDNTTPSQFYNTFVQDFTNGKYTAYLMGREKRRQFYLSPGWLALKKHIMDTHEHRCVVCGTHKDLSIDHIQSRYNHPELELEPTNCQVMCRSCNIAKSWK
jgi:hypothetical protein